MNSSASTTAVVVKLTSTPSAVSVGPKAPRRPSVISSATPATAGGSTIDPHGDRAWADNKFATALDLTALSGTVNTLSTSVTNLDTFVQDCLTRVANIEQGTAWLAGVNSTGPVNVVGDNLTISRDDPGSLGAYRFRTTGGGLDLEVAGLDVIVSHWQNADFTGTQKSLMRWESAGPHLIGRTQFGTSPYDTVHDIDATTGVAGVGAKNGLTNIRLAGFKNSAGAPTTGAWTAGDVVLDSAGAWHLCSASGTPGTWT